MKPSTSEKIAKLMKSKSFRDRSAHIRRMLILAEKIYGRRNDLGMTQSQLAHKAKTTQRIISELEWATYAPANGIGEDLFDRLAAALQIDRDYLFSEKITRRSFELFVYIGQKLNWKWDIMQFMKLPYFIDLNSVNELGFQVTNFTYVRYEYGPFDKNIYAYRSLFGLGGIKSIHFNFSEDVIGVIDKTLESLPIQDGEMLKKLAYETKPMKKIGATIGGSEHWGEKLDLDA